MPPGAGHNAIHCGRTSCASCLPPPLNMAAQGFSHTVRQRRLRHGPPPHPDRLRFPAEYNHPEPVGDVYMASMLRRFLSLHNIVAFDPRALVPRGASFAVHR
eukprot:16440239-Heterocapsa_arctica.AAC.1